MANFGVWAALNPTRAKPRNDDDDNDDDDDDAGAGTSAPTESVPPPDSKEEDPKTPPAPQLHMPNDGALRATRGALKGSTSHLDRAMRACADATSELHAATAQINSALAHLARALSPQSQRTSPATAQRALRELAAWAGAGAAPAHAALRRTITDLLDLQVQASTHIDAAAGALSVLTGDAGGLAALLHQLAGAQDMFGVPGASSFVVLPRRAETQYTPAPGGASQRVGRVTRSAAAAFVEAMKRAPEDLGLSLPADVSPEAALRFRVAATSADSFLRALYGSDSAVQAYGPLYLVAEWMARRPPDSDVRKFWDLGSKFYLAYDDVLHAAGEIEYHVIGMVVSVDRSADALKRASAALLELFKQGRSPALKRALEADLKEEGSQTLERLANNTTREQTLVYAVARVLVRASVLAVLPSPTNDDSSVYDAPLGATSVASVGAANSFARRYEELLMQNRDNFAWWDALDGIATPPADFRVHQWWLRQLTRRASA